MKKTAIFGQINPIITLVEQTNIFNPSPSYITANYMTAVANNYLLGANEANFRILYGNCAFNEKGDVVEFKTVHSDSTTLSGDDISTWGENDSVVLEALAKKQGTTITKIVSGYTENMGMMF